jgi:hypothetical protein
MNTDPYDPQPCFFLFILALLNLKMVHVLFVQKYFSTEVSAPQHIGTKIISAIVASYI